MNQTLHLVELRLAHQRPHARALHERVAHFRGLGRHLCRLRRLLHLRPRNQHPRRRIARLPRVAKALLHPLRHRRLEIRIFEQDVGRLAPKLLRHPLHRRRGRHRHRDTRSRRPCERHHRHIGMRRNRSSHRRPIAIHQIENARRDAGFIHDLRKQVSGERRNFTRLQNHRAACRQRRSNLADDLIHGPVPRRDQSAHSNRFLPHERRTFEPFKFKVLQHLDDFQQMRDSRRSLRLPRERARRAHFPRNGVSHLLHLRLINVDTSP